MRRSWRTCLGDSSGVAALEFALIAPLLAGVLILGADGWLRASQVSNMRSGLQTGARYYQTGGSDDAGASALAMSAWDNRPTDATLTAVRSCACGTLPVACASLCDSANPPAAYITLTATGTVTGLMNSSRVTQDEVLRVR